MASTIIILTNVYCTVEYMVTGTTLHDTDGSHLTCYIHVLVQYVVLVQNPSSHHP